MSITACGGCAAPQWPTRAAPSVGQTKTSADAARTPPPASAATPDAATYNAVRAGQAKARFGAFDRTA